MHGWRNMAERETGFFEVFHEVGRAVLSVLSVREVCHLLVKRTVQALGLKSSVLLLRESGNGPPRVAASHLVSRDFLAAEPMEGDPGLKEALAGMIFMMQKADEGRSGRLADLIRNEGIASILSVPLSLRGEVIGVMRLYTAQPRVFSADELDVISALTDVGGIAVENARMFEEKGQAISRLLEKGGVEYECTPPLEKYRVRAVNHGEMPPAKSYAYFNRLHRLAGTVASRMDVDEILEAAAREIAEAVGVKGCSLLWLNFHTKELELLATYGLSRAYLDKGALDMDRSLPKVVEGETVFVEDTRTDGRVQYPEAAGREGIVSILSVPIFVKEKVRGVLRLYCSEPRTYPPEDIEFIKALAEIGGIAILNAKLYEARDRDYSFWQSTLRYLGVENSGGDSAE
jgi:GAF domain-containing protein